MVFPGIVRVLEWCRSCSIDILKSVTLSGEQMILSSLLLSLAVEAAYQTMMEQDRMDSTVAL